MDLSSKGINSLWPTVNGLVQDCSNSIANTGVTAVLH